MFLISNKVTELMQYFCLSDPKPVVECSFITEFEDHIFVAMDAEVILFLHDLVSLYIKEKDIGNNIISPPKLQ